MIRKPRPTGQYALRRERAREMMPASDAIAAVLLLNGVADEVRGNRLLVEWNELVGPRVASRTRPEGIRDRTLVVEVATSAWMHELNLLKQSLLERLLERLGPPPLFADIKFRLAGARQRDPVTVPKPRPRTLPAPPKPAMPATGARREQIVREVSAVDDVELRELIARVRITNDR